MLLLLSRCVLLPCNNNDGTSHECTYTTLLFVCCDMLCVFTFLQMDPHIFESFHTTCAVCTTYSSSSSTTTRNTTAHSTVRGRTSFLFHLLDVDICRPERCFHLVYLRTRYISIIVLQQYIPCRCGKVGYDCLNCLLYCSVEQVVVSFLFHGYSRGDTRG